MTGIMNMLAGALRSALPLSGAVASPSTVDGVGNTATITSTQSTCTPTNGTAPFTYFWSRVNGDVSITPVSPSAAITAFRSTTMGAGDIRAANFNCTVTDFLGAVVASNNVNCTLERTI